jgi:formylglycine-generating enzyme required for sulfatase activity
MTPHASGLAGRRLAYGNDFEPLRASLFGTRVKQPSPVGVFVDGDTAEGVSDLSGNTTGWTISLYGRDEDVVEFAYPYDPADGREDQSVGADKLRILRGGSWIEFDVGARATYRIHDSPDGRCENNGFRLCAGTELVVLA